MARKTTKTKETKAPASKNEPQYGVTELAEAVGIAPASVRVALRDLEVEKNFGNKYGWNTKKDFDAITKALKERNAKSAANGPDEKRAKPGRKPRAKK